MIIVSVADNIILRVHYELLIILSNKIEPSVKHIPYTTKHSRGKSFTVYTLTIICRENIHKVVDRLANNVLSSSVTQKLLCKFEQQ